MADFKLYSQILQCGLGVLEDAHGQGRQFVVLKLPVCGVNMGFE